MAHLDELVSVVAAIRGSHALRTGTAASTPGIEDGLHADLSGAIAAPTPERALVRFAPHPESPLPFTEWIARARSQGATRLLLTNARTVERLRPAPPGGIAAEERMLHAFAGTSKLVLGLQTGERMDLYVPHTRFPRRTTLGLDDLLEFMDAKGLGDRLIQRLLWENEHNLHFAEGADWSAFLRSIDDRRLEPLLDAVNRAMSNVAFTRQEQAAWFDLCRNRRNPQFGPIFEFMRSGSAAVPKIDVDVAAQTERLRKALRAIRAYADVHDLKPWRGLFDACLDILDPKVENSTLVDHLLVDTPAGEPSRRLLAAGFDADVFGGMGSWNDLGVEQDEDYRRVSSGLFDQLVPSLEVGANAASM